MSAQYKLAPAHDVAPANADTTNPVPEGCSEPLAAEGAPGKVLATERADSGPQLAQMLQVAAVKHGKSPVQLLTEFTKLSFGSGRLSIDEYFAFGLYDDQALAGADKSQFAGLRAMRDTWMAVNWDESWDGVFADKLSLEVLLRGLGLPTTTTVAFYAEQRRVPAMRVLSNPEALAQFLREADNFPIFGKPADSIQSLGSASFTAYDNESDELIGSQGGRVGVEAFVQEVCSAYAEGYLFQKRQSPHPRVRELVGERLSTIRVMTVLGPNGPEIIRVLWKIPGGGNVADNFWRAGNMLGQLDRETGKIIRVVSGVGTNMREIEIHPDTGAQLIGVEVPNWADVQKLAIDGATVFAKVPLIGWDIGLGENGPLIVEPNNSPDFGLPQIADRRGMLDERMKALIQSRKAERKAFKERLKMQVKSELRDERRRINKSLWNS